ncbi:MAG: MBOAT family protein [Clostridia bacterium]|nr:MBOAT family protein [Clostridia bacterium]
MLFSSLEFLYLFLPITLLLYFVCPPVARNAVLLSVSLIFYGFGEPIYVFLMIFTIGADYLFGLSIAKRVRGGASPKRLLWSAVAFNLALLGFFKYYDFFARTAGLPTLGLSLPIGISFYTFQALSYVIDVARSEVAAQKNPVTFGAYVTLFPQLIAGPIVRYSEVDAQLSHRKHTLARAADGISLFCVGLAKKVLLANPAGELCEALLLRLSDEAGRTVMGAWLWLILFAAQIYFDFSGYSEMAVGLGRIFGFEFPTNFRYPYLARSITEFWRRWHITLSSWFREYVYIPLGGNRKGRLRTYRNLLITWALTGLWHGAEWNFLWWGLYFFLLLSLEKAFLGKKLERCPLPVRHGYALFFILIGWLIFASDGTLPIGGLSLCRCLFGIGCASFSDAIVRYEAIRFLPLLCIMVIGATPLPRKLFYIALGDRPRAAGASRLLLCLASLLICTAYLVDSGYNPFLYFRF